MTTEATEPLTEAQVDALDAAYQQSIAAKEPWESKTEVVDAFKNRAAEMVPALVRDWRAMKAENDELRRRLENANHTAALMNKQHNADIERSPRYDHRDRS